MSDKYKDLRDVLPKKIKIGAFEFRQFRVPPDHEGLRDEEGSNQNDGITDIDQHTIHYDQTLPLGKLLTIVIHELQHAINDVYGINDECQEEHMASQSGKGWTQVYMDNPRFVSWISRVTKQLRKEGKHE